MVIYITKIKSIHIERGLEMKFNKILILSLIFIISLSIISAVSAEDTSDVNITSDNVKDVVESEDYLSLDNSDEILSSDCCGDDDMLDNSIHYVEPDPDNPNQVLKPTVQPVINAANPGDTIILNGTFVHCHFLINKTLTILATPGTSVGVCPHHTHQMQYKEGPSSHGVFYISPEAAGTVISGFSFTNDFYTVAMYEYNPFGVFVDADNVTLENLTFDWVGEKSSTSKWDPNDFLFNAIILNKTVNTTIRNVEYGNVNCFINRVNATDIHLENNRNMDELIENSTIVVSDLTILAGNNGNLKVTLKDGNNNPISAKEITIIINGVSKTVTTDDNGIAQLAVKYDNAGTYYATVAFGGDDDYKSSIGTAKITVNKKSTALTAKKATLKVKKAKKIKVTLKSEGKALAKKQVTIKVNKKTFKAKTNANGVATIKVKVTKKGKFTATVNFAGDSAYKGVTKKVKFTVKK